MGFVNDHTILRLHSQLAAVIRLGFDHVVRGTTHLCLQEDLPKKRFPPFCLDDVSSKAVEASLICLSVVMVCLSDHQVVGVNTGHSPQLRTEALYFGQV